MGKPDWELLLGIVGRPSHDEACEHVEEVEVRKGPGAHAAVAIGTCDVLTQVRREQPDRAIMEANDLCLHVGVWAEMSEKEGETKAWGRCAGNWWGRERAKKRSYDGRMRIRYFTGTGVVKHESGVEQGLRLALYKGARELWARSVWHSTQAAAGNVDIWVKGVPYLVCAVRSAGSYLQIRIGWEEAIK
jgi:hypothetical protein